MKLVIGDKNYSSWSMRPWLVMQHFGLPFDEVMVELFEAGSKDRILGYSASGKVPCLVTDDGVSVWESLAIIETLAEHFPEHAVWPRDAAQRAHARAISAEMVAGFGALRQNMWMNIRASFPGKGRTPESLADIARVDALWSACLERHGGPFLFGEFSAADAMYAPVVMRFNTWQPVLSDAATGYAQRVTAQPAVKAWIDAALRETHRIDKYDTCQ